MTLHTTLLFFLRIFPDVLSLVVHDFPLYQCPLNISVQSRKPARQALLGRQNTCATAALRHAA